MGIDKDRPLGGLKGLAAKVPVVREQAIMQGLEWVNGTAFTMFAQKYPNQAAWLTETVRNNTVATRAVLSALGETASRVMGLESDDIANARIADFLVAFQNMIRLGPSDGAGQATEMQHRLAALPPEQSGAILEKLHALEPERRQRVLRLISTLDAERIGNVLSMDPHTLDMLLSLADLPTREREADDPILEGLRRAGARLKANVEDQRANRP